MRRSAERATTTAGCDVDLGKQRLRVLLSKNNERRGVYFPASAVNARRELKRAPVVGHHVLVEERGQPVDKFWLAYRWKAVRAAASLKDFRWHDLRHSCASCLAQGELLEIGSVLGHKSPRVTKRYQAISPQTALKASIWSRNVSLLSPNIVPIPSGRRRTRAPKSDRTGRDVLCRLQPRSRCIHFVPRSTYIESQNACLSCVIAQVVYTDERSLKRSTTANYES